MKTIRIRVANGVLVAIAVLAVAPHAVRADEGGVSFWLAGQLSSFAATPGAPGFAVPAIYYHSSVDAGGSKQFQLGGNVVAGLNADADLVFLAPTYVFTDPVAGAQASLTMGWAFGRMHANVDEVITGHQGQAIEVGLSDSVTGGSDLYPQAALKWHDGVHNWMTYLTGDIPTGVYHVGRLANIGINHYALDAGGGYTYLDPSKGHEFSAVAGITYNFENNDTDYRNGVDSHLDWAASQFLNEQLLVGLNGYVYYQLTGDGGAGAALGDNKSRVYGAGPQIGYFFPIGKSRAYVNLRANWEWGAENRPEGWNTYLTLSLPMDFGR
jgi:hypothetical protein